MFTFHYVHALLLILCIDYGKSDCVTDFSKLKNILLLRNNEIVYANDGKGNIIILNSDSIHACCPGTTIKGTTDEVRVLTCTSNNYSTPLTSIECNDRVEAKEIYVGTCQKGNSDIRIAFQFNNPPRLRLDQIKVCWDDKQKLALYAYAILTNTISNACPAERPSFKSSFFSGLAKWYTNANQLINKNKHYAPLSPDQQSNNLQKGHLIAFCDFPYQVQKLATNLYTNTAPQWASFNIGNWKILEDKVRRLLQRSHVDLHVLTGTFGTLQLNGKDYYLDGDRNLVPVPRYFWRVITQPNGDSTLAIAIVGSNDIFDTTQTDICTDILSHVTWLDFKAPKDIKKGYMVACTLDNFLNIPGIRTQLPALPVGIQPLL